VFRSEMHVAVAGDAAVNLSSIPLELPLLLLIFLGVVLLIQGLWLIWGQRWLASRGRAARWTRFATDPPTQSGSATEQADPIAAAGPAWKRFGRTPGKGWEWRSRLARALTGDLRDAEFSWPISQIALVMMTAACLGVVVGALFNVPWGLLAVLAGLILLSPWLVAAQRVRRRSARLQDQLGDAVDLIARALRAGHALASALRMVADQSPDPIAREFQKACEQISMGVPADEALRDMAQRSRSEDLRYFVIAVLLQRETGGNLAEVLDNISALVRQRQQLRQSVRALSAEGRLSAWILGILPFALAAVIGAINPELMSLLWTDPAGRTLSVSALLMMAVGIMVMRQMVRVRA